MKVISTNSGQIKKVSWQGKPVETGIYKTSVEDGIILGHSNAEGDAVVDRKHHGGEYKACYLYSFDHYNFWKNKYGDLNWQFGMFGENLTIEGLDENKLLVGDEYKVGQAIIKISEPRQPCFKLGIRFENQQIIKELINSTFSGAYCRVISSGKVTSGDELELTFRNNNSPSIAEVFQVIYKKTNDTNIIRRVFDEITFSSKLKDSLKKKYTSG